MIEVTKKYYQDPGHGWVAVKTKELEKLGITGKISAYSYQKGATTYLEEDMDAGTYIAAQDAAGVQVNFKKTYTDGRSPIRSYAPYPSTLKAENFFQSYGS